MTSLTGKKIVMVVAHPDDEVIFGWPILQIPDVKIHVICCSSDRNNPARAEFFRRREALKHLMDDLGHTFQCFNYDSEFYRMPTRGEELSNVLSLLMNTITKTECDFVYSHNPLGEYGHIDHILIHQLVASCCSKMLTTDIFLRSNWVPYGSFSEVFKRCYFRDENKVGTYQNDLQQYERCKQTYLSYQAWTWSKPPVQKASLYLL